MIGDEDKVDLLLLFFFAAESDEGSWIRVSPENTYLFLVDTWCFFFYFKSNKWSECCKMYSYCWSSKVSQDGWNGCCSSSCLLLLMISLPLDSVLFGRPDVCLMMMIVDGAADADRVSHVLQMMMMMRRMMEMMLNKPELGSSSLSFDDERQDRSCCCNLQKMRMTPNGCMDGSGAHLMMRWWRLAFFLLVFRVVSSSWLLMKMMSGGSGCWIGVVQQFEYIWSDADEDVVV